MTGGGTRIRPVRITDLNACAGIEEVAYGGSGATRGRIERRIREYPAGFRVAVAGKRVVGFINSGCIRKDSITSERLKDLAGHDPAGKTRVIFSLAVLPEFQGQGIGSRLLERFLRDAGKAGKARVLLICRRKLIPFYRRFGFVYRGTSRATYGGYKWHELMWTAS